MHPYHKIETVYKRDPENRYKTLLLGEFARPAFAYLADRPWTFTEKVHGTNVRISTSEGKRVIGGKTDMSQLPVFLFSKLTDLFTADALGSVFEGDNFTLYGEGYGAKIQKGGGNYNPSGVNFVLFDVWVDGWWLRRDDVIDVAEKLQIETVPIIGSGTLIEMVNMVSCGFNSTWGDFRAEGIVARPEVELFDRAGRRIITKIKCKDFARN